MSEFNIKVTPKMQRYASSVKYALERFLNQLPQEAKDAWTQRNEGLKDLLDFVSNEKLSYNEHMYEFEAEHRTIAEEMAKKMIGFASDSSVHRAAFVQGILTEHPTLQQYFMEVVLAFIVFGSLSFHKGRFDERNKATLMLCDAFNEVLKDRTGLRDEYQQDLVSRNKRLLPTI